MESLKEPITTRYSIYTYVEDIFTHDGLVHFQGLFLVPMICSLAAAMGLALFFRPPKTPAVATGGP